MRDVHETGPETMNATLSLSAGLTLGDKNLHHPELAPTFSLPPPTPNRRAAERLRKAAPASLSSPKGDGAQKGVP